LFALDCARLVRLIPAAMSSEKQQRLVLSIIDFLNQSISDGTVKADDKESLEVAGEFAFLGRDTSGVVFINLKLPYVQFNA